MKKRFLSHKSNKTRYVKIVIIGIIISTFLWFGLFSKRLAPKILKAGEIRSNARVYKLINQSIHNSLIGINPNDLLVFKRNNSNELILTEYNLNEVYKLMNRFNKNMSDRNKEFIVFIPTGMGSKHFLINGLGSKIPIKVYLANNYYTNLRTKVTNYGINNALVEVYFVIEVSRQFIYPFSRDTIKNKYEILISTHFITGTVPNFYGKSFDYSSKIFDIYSKI